MVAQVHREIQTVRAPTCDSCRGRVVENLRTASKTELGTLTCIHVSSGIPFHSASKYQPRAPFQILNTPWLAGLGGLVGEDDTLSEPRAAPLTDTLLSFEEPRVRTQFVDHPTDRRALFSCSRSCDFWRV